MTIDHRTKIREFNVSQPTSGPSRPSIIVIVDAAPLDFAMRLTATTNIELALATGYNTAYVSKIRAGILRRVSRVFLADAARYLSGRWRRPEALVTEMMKER